MDLSALTVLPKTELIVDTLAVVGLAKFGKTTGEGINWIILVYWIGVIVSASILFIKIISVKKRLRRSKDGDAFSFWKTKVIDQKLSGLSVISAHENIHVKQLHTFDLLLLELFGVFFWFNPIVYVYRKSLKLIHEYLADEYASNLTTSKKQYAMLLFLQNLNAGPSLANTFYNAPMLTLRIKMLQQKKSNRYRALKYALCLPLIALLCSFNTSSFTSHYDGVDQAASFPGGFDAFSQYLIANARKVSPTNGGVVVSFVVEANGDISNEKVEKSLDQASDKEALRLIKASQKWKPALQNGEKVRSAYRIAINL